MRISMKMLALLISAAMLVGCASAVDTRVDGTVEAKPQQTVTAEAGDSHNEAQQTTAATTTTVATTTTAATTEATTTTAATTEATATTAATTEATTTTVTEATTVAATTEATTAAITTTAATTTATSAENVAEPDEVVEIKYVALTFDDGPNTTTTAEVLDMLEKYDIVASFFLIGNNINEESAKVVKRAYDMGCEINNHSTSHPYMNQMSVDEVIAEFTATDDKIYEITGERSKFFRPPYIAVSQDMLDNIDVPFISGIGCNDWDDKVPVDRRSAMILRQVKEGSIILLHDAQGNSKTVEALDTLIPEMQAQGYEFVTVTKLFELSGVEISGTDEKIYSNVFQTSIY